MGKLGQLLVARGWITVQQLTRGLHTQQVVGGRLGTSLLEMDALSEDNLLKGLSEQLGVPPVNLDDLRGIPEEVIGLIPDKIARRCRAIPFRVVGSRLDVAMIDPRNLASQDEVAFASGKRVLVHVAHELRIMEALERYYREESSSRFSLISERLNRARYFWDRDRQPEPTRSEDELTRLPPLPSPLTNRMAMPAMRPAAAPAPAPRPVAPPIPIPAPIPVAKPVSPAAAAPAAPQTPVAPVVAPVKRPTVQTVTMTEEERAALALLPTPAATPATPAPSSIEEVEAAFARTHDREEAGRIALGFLAHSYRRAALFQVTKDKVAAWMAQGELDLSIFQKFFIRFDQPSLFLNLRNGSNLYLGPLPPMPAHRELARAWGGELPRDCVLLPVRINERLVAVLYADGGVKPGKGIGGIGGMGGMGGIDLSQLQRLAIATGTALERCILHRKHAEAKP
ncbi:MAG TPA: hypothetical protein VN493_04350 [Thermoanaerobaculia bacterium]|nr:hypothetical protein [Thermoanaerobaculia bacterium]